MLKMKKQIFALSFALFIGLFSIAASAQNAPEAHQRQALRLNLGYQGGYNRTELAYITPTLWESTLFGRTLDLQLEAGFAYWHTNNSRVRYGSRSNLWQINLIPMFRYWLNQNWYAEAGIGATMLSHTRFANKDLSTKFQFGDHIGIGRTFGDNWRASIRYSHFSNASIKRPNPGLNIVQFSLTRSF